jgi:hypothetical protein
MVHRRQTIKQFKLESLEQRDRLGAEERKYGSEIEYGQDSVG